MVSEETFDEMETRSTEVEPKSQNSFSLPNRPKRRQRKAKAPAKSFEEEVHGQLTAKRQD